MDTHDTDCTRAEELGRILKYYKKRKHTHKTSVGKLSNASRIRHYKQMLSQNNAMPLAERKLLDVGCSTGGWLVCACDHWGGKLQNCYGLELRQEVVEQGREMYPGLNFIAASADKMPLEDEYFDIVHQSMMLSSVLEGDFQKAIANEMWRVLKPGGYILWFDFICNPFNPNTMGMRKKHVRRLFPHADWIDCKRIGVAPPICRVVNHISERIVPWLEKLLFLNAYYLVMLQKPKDGAEMEIT